MGEIKEKSVSFFLPKAEADERKMVEKRNAKYWLHYYVMKQIDVDKNEKALSESNSKYIFYCGHREAIRFENLAWSMDYQLVKINRKRKKIERAKSINCKINILSFIYLLYFENFQGSSK